MSNSEKFKHFIRNYWDYYRELEYELLQTKRYVDFSQDNFTSYSIEFLKLYQTACSEIDVIGKSLAAIHDEMFCPDDKKNNIYKWWYVIQDMTVVDVDDDLEAFADFSKLFVKIERLTSSEIAALLGV